MFEYVFFMYLNKSDNFVLIKYGFFIMKVNEFYKSIDFLWLF